MLEPLQTFREGKTWDTPPDVWHLSFQDGTLVVRGASASALPAGFQDDDRIGAPRGPGWLYQETVLSALSVGQEYEDRARSWENLNALQHLAQRTARPYQREAVDAWHAAGRRGAVVLPTGSGKTYVAELAIAEVQRPTLVCAPTLDLVGQWHDRLRAAFGADVGVLGGGHHEVRDLTVSTYDSAWRHIGRYGDRFGMLVFDEVHHLPAPGYRAIAASALAPFRLGLTATWERDDGEEQNLSEILGPVVFRRTIPELSGEFLADYETVRLTVHLSPEELDRYTALRQVYLSFVGRNRIPIRSRNGWQVFLRYAARSREGRAAHKAWMAARRIQHGTEQKLDLLGTLLQEEHGRRTIIFTHDNATAYRVSREFLVPCISHQTEVKERRAYLRAFEAGSLPVLVTSRVLNEGVDLPAAEVAIVLSGTGTVREHVQRLGRILRPGVGKQAVLYELVAAGTAEVRTSARRREHDAYQR
ncbi:MAG: DEAD/DEAH box helicase family protein [Myxococcota bacterium]|nr:DEAD/DEAH box helicase family protein [Myxococcota bacterium]MEC8423837.1 DEAD/DEAH box helicase family protein [Myxococcota bacterium]